MALSERLEIAKRHIQSSRDYLLTLLDGLDEADWTWMPNPAISHIAWQVGHLAMAQYGLCLFRQRGRADIDSDLMSGSFRKKFMKGTHPVGGAENYPPSSEILSVLEGIHRQTMLELPDFDGEQLDQPLEQPYAAFATRYGSLIFAGDHEMLHAGQIGMLRRLMGKPPVR